MRYGVCCSSSEISEAAAKAGFDFVEWPVTPSLQPLEKEDSFKEKLQQLKAASLPCEAVNCLLPGSLPVTGPEVEREKLAEYLETAFSRASQTGIKTVVFGSGKARRIPPDLDRREGQRQIMEFCRMLYAGRYRRSSSADSRPGTAEP